MVRERDLVFGNVTTFLLAATGGTSEEADNDDDDHDGDVFLAAVVVVVVRKPDIRAIFRRTDDGDGCRRCRFRCGRFCPCVVVFFAVAVFVDDKSDISALVRRTKDDDDDDGSGDVLSAAFLSSKSDPAEVSDGLLVHKRFVALFGFFISYFQQKQQQQKKIMILLINGMFTHYVRCTYYYVYYIYFCTK